MQPKIEATYWLESPCPLEHAAEVIAGEQSSGTFTAVPGETLELKRQFGAKVESIESLGTTDCTSLRGKYDDTATFNRGVVKISWPLGNCGPSLPTLLSMISGNLWELKEVSGLRLVDVTLPTAFSTRYPGPQFGIKGTRELSGVAKGPLIGTIIKPSIGLTPEQTAELVTELCEGGIDFIKDDELMGNPDNCPFMERVTAVLGAIQKYTDRTGRKVMFAANITDDLDRMLDNLEFVHAHGGTCVMVVVNSVGFTALAHVRKHSSLPIHAHRAGWGLLGRSPSLGWDYNVWQKFARLAGGDHLHVCGLRNKFWEDDQSVISSARSCLAPVFADGPSFAAVPVFSGGQWADQAKDTFDALASSDLIFTAGGGILAHPLGIGAGVRAIREAWEGAANGLTLAQVAKSSVEVREAIKKFGKKEAQTNE